MKIGDYERIEKTIQFLEKNFRGQPDLGRIARSAGLSEYHFQRLFTRWVGISPKRFLKYLTVEYAKQRLDASQSVLDAALEAGLSGPGRLHDLFITVEGMTPGEFKTGGRGVALAHGCHDSPFGKSLMAVSDRGLCSMSFVDRGHEIEAVRDLRARWPEAEIREDSSVTLPVFERVFAAVVADVTAPVPVGVPGSGHAGSASRLKLFLRGSPFQIKVWRALLQIPPGLTLSYSNVARLVGAPSASRAVAQAIARNPIAYLIPCHRVIRSIGVTGGYRWGTARKKAMLAWEAARAPLPLEDADAPPRSSVASGRSVSRAEDRRAGRVARPQSLTV